MKNNSNRLVGMKLTLGQHKVFTMVGLLDNRCCSNATEYSELNRFYFTFTH